MIIFLPLLLPFYFLAGIFGHIQAVDDMNFRIEQSQYCIEHHATTTQVVIDNQLQGNYYVVKPGEYLKGKIYFCGTSEIDMK